MFQELIAWSLREFAHLPWRKNRTLYKTLVSEIMLQQTTVPTVLKKFDLFIETFPDFLSLAQVDSERLLIAWKGLGYYRRVKNLKAAAMAISREGLPRSVEDLKKFPGIGEYTANALMAIGHNKPALALDANLERVLCRIFAIPLKKGPNLKKTLKNYLLNSQIPDILAKFPSRELTEALMDLGRVICQANRTKCEICPVNKSCQAFKLKMPLHFPSIESKEKIKYDLDLVRLIIKREEKFFMIKRSHGFWLEGQWELPSFILHCSDKSLKQYPRWDLPSLEIPKIPAFKSSITKYKIRNFLLEISEKEFKRFFKLNGKYFDRKNQNITTATLKTFKFL